MTSLNCLISIGYKVMLASSKCQVERITGLGTEAADDLYQIQTPTERDYTTKGITDTSKLQYYIFVLLSIFKMHLCKTH